MPTCLTDYIQGHSSQPVKNINLAGTVCLCYLIYPDITKLQKALVQLSKIDTGLAHLDCLFDKYFCEEPDLRDTEGLILKCSQKKIPPE